MKKQVYFELPRSSIKGIPLENASKEHLNLGLIEIGMTPSGKRLQVNSRQIYIHELWEEFYVKTKKASWFPEFTRTIAYYRPEENLYNLFGFNENYMPTSVLRFTKIPEDVYQSMTGAQQLRLINSVKKSLRENIALLFEYQDPEYIDHFIHGEKDNPSYASFRGLMGEVIALNVIDNNLPNGMNLYRNGSIQYFRDKNKEISDLTEVDGVLTYYNRVVYEELIDKCMAVKGIKLIRKNDLIQ